MWRYMKESMFGRKELPAWTGRTESRLKDGADAENDNDNDNNDDDDDVDNSHCFMRTSHI